MDALTDDQRQSVLQLREITNGADDEVSVSVLRSVEWDVQRAAELIFGTSAPPRPPAMETFEIDDSHQGAEPPARQTHTPSSSLLPRPLLSLLAFPFHVISSIFRFIFGILRIPVPQFRFTGLNFYRPLRPRPLSRGGPDKWLRELEEETGAVSIGRSKVPRGTSSSLNIDPGQSSLTSRISSSNTLPDDGRKYLPDFTISSYEDMLRLCQTSAKIGCVILVTDEHDDVPEFKRSTLTDPDFVKTLYNNDIIVWGGDVRDREAWSAAEKLQATTFPFVAFLALQPRRSPASSSSRSTSPPSLTVLSRHQGKSYPSTAPTSAHTLVDHLEQQLLPRVTPFLNRILATQRERENERRIREEQDRAFQNTARRDKERIEAKMAAERAEREALRVAQAEALLAEQRRAKEAELARQKESNRMEWRRWTRRAIVNSQPKSTTTAGCLRIAIRLPNGARVVQSFSQSTSVTGLFAFIDSQLIPAQFSSSDDPISLPDLKGSGEDALEAHISNYQDEYWGFRVALAYPRIEIPWKSAAQLSEITQLKGGGQVVVELVHSGRNSPPNDDEDDGYHTEDSE